jgi:hypothetical protein
VAVVDAKHRIAQDDDQQSEQSAAAACQQHAAGAAATLLAADVEPGRNCKREHGGGQHEAGVEPRPRFGKRDRVRIDRFDVLAEPQQFGEPIGHVMNLNLELRWR